MLWQYDQVQIDHVLLTMPSVDPKIQQQTAHTDTAGTIGDSSHQHSCRSRGSDGQNASHSAYTSYSAWPSLVAGSCKKRKTRNPVCNLSVTVISQCISVLWQYQ